MTAQYITNMCYSILAEVEQLVQTYKEMLFLELSRNQRVFITRGEDPVKSVFLFKANLPMTEERLEAFRGDLKNHVSALTYLRESLLEEGWDEVDLNIHVSGLGKITPQTVMDNPPIEDYQVWVTFTLTQIAMPAATSLPSQEEED